MAGRGMAYDDTAINNIEYQFPENVAEHRLRKILRSKRVIVEDDDGKDKEDLIFLFKRYLQPLPQRTYQLTRLGHRRKAKHLVHTSQRKQNNVNFEEKGDVLYNEKKRMSTCSTSELCQETAPKKPVKLKRRHECDDGGTEKHRHRSRHSDSDDKATIVQEKRAELSTSDNNPALSTNRKDSHKSQSDLIESDKSLKDGVMTTFSDTRQYSDSQEHVPSIKVTSHKHETEDGHEHKKYKRKSSDDDDSISPHNKSKARTQESGKAKISKITWP